MSSTLRSGDTLSLAAGNYSSFAVSSTMATTTLTISGAGASTVVHADTNMDALRLTNVTSSVVSGMVLQNASSTSYSYSANRMVYDYLGHTYGDAVDGMFPANSTLIVDGPGCSNFPIPADATDITSYVGDGTQNFNVALSQIGGSRITIIARNDIIASSSDLLSSCGGAGLTVDKFLTGALAPYNHTFVFQSIAAAGEGVTMSAGFDRPVPITSTLNAYAGLKLDGSNGVTVTSVTSTANGYGVWFSSGIGNSVVDSVLSSSAAYDVRADASATNTLDNVTFTRVSSTISVAPVLVKFRARVQAYRAASPGTAVSGSSATATDAASAASALGATTGSGYTGYARLPAYSITNASNAVTTGGFNPYTFTAGAVTGYAASSSSVNLSSRDQVVTLAMLSSVAPTAPTGAATSTLGTTSSTISWTDASDDETSFILEYATTSDAGDFPGTAVSVAADATSEILATLFPNYTYQARVAAVNGSGTSAYSTTTYFTTRAAAPGAPSLSALSGTTASVAIDTGSNSTSTQYAVYNSTASAYIGSGGSGSASPAWLTSSTWAGLTVSGLSCGTTYSFVAVARNLDQLVTATSSAGTVSTSACPSSGGGGGGGASGFGLSVPFVSVTPLPAPANPVSTQLAPTINVTFLDPAAPAASAPSDSPVIPPSLATLRSVGADASAFRVTLSVDDRARLGAFVEVGTTPETRALGAGERRALLRDAFETLGRSVPTSDLERLARGQVPLTRNLAAERAQLPRVRTTFRTIYGHDPDFRDAEQNLAWNTLMYRVRFPRDLAAERQGIQEFRSTFHRSPQDPFQWAAVRALGYVQR